MTVNTLPANEECNCFAVRATARHVSQSYDQFLAPAGLRTTQFSILTKLKRKGPVTINTLAEDMVMDRTTLGRNILPLERDGLIRIEPSASDRARFGQVQFFSTASLTSAGRKGSTSYLNWRPNWSTWTSTLSLRLLQPRLSPPDRRLRQS